MGKREEQKRETLERLRNVIDELVSKKGFDAVTIREICEQTGVSTGVFYHYFSSKDDILFDRYLRANNHWDGFKETLSSTCNSQFTSHEVLRSIILETMQYALSRVPSVAVSYHKTILPEYRNWTALHPDAYRSLLHEFFHRAEREHALRESAFTSDQLADMLWSMTFGIRFCLVMDGYEFDQKSAAFEQILAWLDSLFID